MKNTNTPEQIRRMATSALLDVWEETEQIKSKEVFTVRWIMDELERRNPDGFAAWIDQDAPEDKDLRR